MNKALVEQVGGDERAAFEAAFAAMGRPVCRADYDQDAYGTPFDDGGWTGWQARAALAQPSPMRCLACGGYHGNSGLPCPNMRVTAQAQPSPAGVQLSASRERRIYIAGPMTGYKDCNFPAFNAQAEALRGLGYHVENPADHGVVDGAEWQDYLRYDISRLSTCEAIFLLPGWSKSKGAALEVYIAKALGMTFIHHADAEREQPSPVQPEEAPVIGCLCGMPMTEGHHSPDGCSSLEEFAPHLSAQAQAKQAERPEVAEVAFVLRNIGAMDAEDIDGDNVDLRFEDAEGRDTGCDVSIVEYAEKAADLFEQHDRIVGELRAVITQLHQHKNDYMDAGQETYRALQNEIREREAEIARLDGLVSVRTAERDAALARVAELERQQPVAWMHDQPNRVDVIHRDVKDLLQRVPGSSRGIYRPLDVSEHYTIPLYAAPVAQAQHSAPEVSGIGRDTGHPRAVVLYLRKEPTDDDLRAIHDALRSLAAAPGKEVPQAWLDVQAERRRQITAEGWTPEHDDLYCAAELPRAAAAYILNGANDEAPAIWPFSAKWWKPRDARANYVRAAALILAEIERLDRAAAAGKEVGHE
ncbi:MULTISPECIES: DUF4406 domain-containing protein [Pseudomonas]|uniref:DUF4406 domain-containing protein n=1 Tax=Pseudomonas TaxID=286 RepID=UPI002022EF88|nr:MULTISPECIES: DUF4406 domain-containing protein [Pseudomonas]